MVAVFWYSAGTDDPACAEPDKRELFLQFLIDISILFIIASIFTRLCRAISIPDEGREEVF